MTNTKFRKRALLSSVAMLLVALVALGSATFAWFVANPTATASGLAIKTEAAPGLVIASESVKTIFSSDTVSAFKGTTVIKAEGTTSDYATTDVTLQPASPYLTLNDGILTFGNAPAAYSSAATIATGADWGTGSVYSEKIYVKTSTTDAGTVSVGAIGVRINQTNTLNTAKDGVKVAIVAHQGQIGTSGEDGYVAASDTLIGIWKPTNGAASATWNGTTGTSGALVSDPAYAYSASGASKTMSLTATTSQTDNYITAYFYLDGEDDGVFSDNITSLTQLVDSIDIRLSTTSAVTF